MYNLLRIMSKKGEGFSLMQNSKIEQEETTESRRKFIKFAVYTPPALMLMSNASATYVKDTNGVVKKRPKRKADKRKIKRKVKRKVKRKIKRKIRASNGVKRRIKRKRLS